MCLSTISVIITLNNSYSAEDWTPVILRNASLWIYSYKFLSFKIWNTCFAWRLLSNKESILCKFRNLCPYLQYFQKLKGNYRLKGYCIAYHKCPTYHQTEVYIVIYYIKMLLIIYAFAINIFICLIKHVYDASLFFTFLGEATLHLCNLTHF